MAEKLGVVQVFKVANRHLAAFLCRLAHRMPKNRFGDSAVSLTRFYQFHGRLPYRRKSFNDLLCRIQINGDLDNFLRVYTTDKELAKSFISSVVGAEHVVETIAIIRNEQELDAFVFPQRCCIKGTAGSGLAKIVEDGVVDRDALVHWLSENQYDFTRERNYKPLTPKIIVEPLIFDNPVAENI
ncbi:MAG: ATP-grasp fold amidoligase family protein [Minwuia sp.]|nr:ATP-grasp fold amidoligase family protein [Minwuia sp.]